MRLVAALYHFARLDDLDRLQSTLRAEGAAAGVVGSLLLAPEGINGTISGAAEPLRGYIDRIRSEPALSALRWKESWAATPPFRGFKVRLKREIVSMGAPDIVRPETVGDYVAADDWNALIDDPKVAVVDVRNAYETRIGGFAGAIDPETATFRDFPAWARGWTSRAPDGPVAMYCTGGIRCEKATALMRSLGRRDVYHLDGGVLAYLKSVPEAESRWRGQCFVFDERVSVGHGVAPGPLSLCRGCRRPLTAEDRADPRYEEGVACPACADDATPAQRAARRERRRQIQIAKARGGQHLARAPISSGRAD